MNLYVFEYADGTSHYVGADSITQALGYFTEIIADIGMVITRTEKNNHPPCVVVVFTQYSRWLDSPTAMEATVNVLEYKIKYGEIGRS